MSRQPANLVTQYPEALKVLFVGTVEADPDLTTEVLREAYPDCQVRIARGERQALDILVNGSRPSTHPHLVIIDWNLASGGAERLLNRMKGEPSLQPLPVAVLTDSYDPAEVRRAYDLNASCVVVRASDPAETGSRFRTLLEFWARTAQVPRFTRSAFVG